MIMWHAGKVKTDSKKLAESPALTGISGGLAKLALKITDPEKDEGLLPDAIEDKIIDALAAWLKGSLK